MTRSTFTFLFCVCASFVLYAQDTARAVLKFDKTVHWVPNVHEGDVAEYKFRFVNDGNAPLVITEVVQAQFTPDNYLKEPIAPGDSGFVVIRYVTSGKTGYFDKTATIRSNSCNGDVVLHLNGEVMAKPSPDAPIMKFDSTWYWFDTVFQGSVVDHEFRFTNTGKTPLIISNATGSSGSIVPYYPKEPIAPGQSAMIRFVYNTTGKVGPQDKTVTVMSNATEPVIVLHLKGYVVPPAPPPPARSGPVLKFDAPVFSFDTVVQGEMVTHEFRFTNTGKDVLIIQEVVGSDGGAAAHYSVEPVAPGQTGIITVVYDTSTKTGFHDKSFAVVTNCAERTQYIHLQGTIVVNK